MVVDMQNEMPTVAGIHDLTRETASGSMRYSLYLPEDNPADGSRALVLVLHYGGQPVGFYGRPLIEQLILPAFGALNPVIVAPVSMSGDWTNPQNEQAVMSLLETLEQTYATDPCRRVISGYSMGSVGTWHMVAQHGSYFSAAISVSGFKSIDPRNCKTPIYALHSRIDSIFNADQLSAEIDELVAAGCDAQVDFIDGVDHFDIPAFAPLVKTTLPWLMDLWQDDAVTP